ncbi:galactose-3-O-sulfotransferase 3-like isoform X2 [Portunus trituberculatus]|uniref:galactose-3-O-sulfotransferase 3-like isoform X2 n=1 Tax=Portunus trituberculatus TaxID=210409 RepID=UPI001E1CDA5D|nr:galactose-3-O-sulfotransferase 3-like isoform X2 [Portunus trituberculatus]
MSRESQLSWSLLAYHPRLYVRMMMSVVIVATLLCGSALLKNQILHFSTRPSRLKLKTCLPRNNVAFLKTHKSASSAIQNILFRYGDKHNLHFALPNIGNHFGGKLSFKAAMVRSSPLNIAPNIFAIHTKWDHMEVKKVMPEDTVFFTIVREPTDLFQSLFTYSKFQEITGLSLHEYVRRVPANSSRLNGIFGYNQMSWDFGMPLEDMNNRSAIHELVKQADEHFGLVLVMERIDESLVLLAEYLCWELSDVLMLKVNSLRDKLKPSISEETRQVLHQKLAPDYLLYNHFLERFNQQVKDFGLVRMAAAVARLQELMMELVSTCNFVRKDASELRGGQKPYSNKVDGFESGGGGSCDKYTLTEKSYINVLRKKQQRTIAEKSAEVGDTEKCMVPLPGRCLLSGLSQVERQK